MGETYQKRINEKGQVYCYGCKLFLRPDLFNSHIKQTGPDGEKLKSPDVNCRRCAAIKQSYFSLKKIFKAQGFDGVIQEMRRAAGVLNRKIEAYVRLCGEVLPEEGEPEPKEKMDKPQSASGKAKGGHARAASLTPERRKEIARKAVTARWAKQRKKEELTDDAG